MKSVSLLPAIFLVFFFGFFPLFYAFYNSFYHDIYGERTFAGFENYRYLLDDKGFFYSLRISTLWAFLNAFFTVIISISLALILSSKKFSSKLLYLSLLVPWGIPIYISVPVWRGIIHGIGGESILSEFLKIHVNLLTDPVKSFFAVLFVSVWLNVPITTFLILGQIRNVPKIYMESVKMDGGTSITAFFSVILPSIRSQVLTISLLNFIKSFKEFTLITLMTAGGPPIPEGFTERSIIGATTTVGIFIYDIFKGVEDTGVIFASSAIVSAVVLSITMLWIFSLKEKKNFKAMILVVSLLHICFSGKQGLVFGPLYLLSCLFPYIFKYIVFSDLLTMITLTFKNGFLESFNFATIVALLVYSTSGGETPLALKGNYLKIVLKPLAFLLVFIQLLLAALPIWNVLWMSFSKVNTVLMDRLFPYPFTLENFVKIVRDENIPHYFLNTLVVSSAAALLVPIIAFPASYTLSRSKGKKDIFLVFLSLIGVSGGIHTLVPLFSFFKNLGLIDTYVPLVLIYTTHSMTFSVYTMKSFLDNMPKELDDVAKMEGMKLSRYVMRILLPLSLPVVLTSVMVSFLNAWNGFLVPLIFLMDDSKYTIGVKLFSYVGTVGSASPKWNLFASASVLNMIVTTTIFYLFRKPMYTSHMAEYEG